MIFIAVRQDRKHRPKDFLARNRHVVGDAREQRGAYEIALR
jgi:hypothetical protein